MKIWDKLRIARIFIQLLFNPNRTDLIFQAVDIISENPDQEALRAIEEHMLSDAVFRSMYEENYVPENPSLDVLSQCPDGSFGKAVYQHMTTNELNFELWPRGVSKSPIHYLTTRIYQDHDLWHALFGYGISVEDEVAIQAFGVAQFQSPIALMLVAGGVLRLLAIDPRKALEAFKSVNAMYRLGQEIPFLISKRLHEHFNEPLEDVRKLCNVA